MVARRSRSEARRFWIKGRDPVLSAVVAAAQVRFLCFLLSLAVVARGEVTKDGLDQCSSALACRMLRSFFV
jgi:hypothetical protein